jgi:tetratricopeptide (TPR) repeat protein
MARKKHHRHGAAQRIGPEPERGARIGAASALEGARQAAITCSLEARLEQFGSRNLRLLSALLFIAVVIVYLPSLTQVFAGLDDGTYVTGNLHVQAGLSWPSLQWAFAASEASNWHPVTWLSHMLDCQLFGLNARGHHLTSVLLHGLNTVLLFTVLRRMSGAIWCSLLVAALFGLHPLRVESVAWVAERKDVLSALFFFLTLLAYTWYVARSQAEFGVGKVDGQGPTYKSTQNARTSPRAPRLTLHAPRFTLHPGFYYALALLLFALGLLSKPMLVTLPFVLLLLDYWPLRRKIRNPKSEGRNPNGESLMAAMSFGPRISAFFRTSDFGLRILVEKLPFFFLAALSSLATYCVQKHAGAMSMIIHLPFSARLENALVAYCRYLGKCFWPVNLSIIYGHPGSWSLWAVAISAIVLAGISVLALVRRRQSPYLPVGWFWFLGMLVPAIGLVQVGWQSMADRYTYLPLVGIFILLVWGTEEVKSEIQRPRGEGKPKSEDRTLPAPVESSMRLPAGAAPTSDFGIQLCVTAAVVILGACAVLTNHQLGYWQSSEALFGHAVQVEPWNFLAHGNLGNALQRQGRMTEALAEYQEVLRLKSDDVNTRNGLGSLMMNLGSLDQAIAQFRQALQQMPDFAEAHNNLAFALEKQGKHDEAVYEYEAALRIHPDDYRVRLNLAAILLQQGKLEETIRQLRNALESKPDDVITRKTLGSLLFNDGRIEEALKEFQEAVRTAPNDAEAQANLGIALSKAGRKEEAVVHLTRALQLRPDYPQAQAELRALTGK